MNTKFLLILSLLLSLCTVASVSHGADCQQLKQGIKKQRNFMLRRTMVEEAFALCSEDATIVFMYAFSRERFGQLEEALKYYTKAAVLDAKMAKAFFGMADVYVELGKNDLALMAYAKGLTIDPINVRAIRAKTALESTLPQTNPMAGVK